MLELAILLTVGYLGGRSRRVVWIFLISAVVLVATPIYLVQEREVVGVIAVISLTLLAIVAVQLGALTGLLVSRRSVPVPFRKLSFRLSQPVRHGTPRANRSPCWQPPKPR